MKTNNQYFVKCNYIDIILSINTKMFIIIYSIYIVINFISIALFNYYKKYIITLVFTNPKLISCLNSLYRRQKLAFGALSFYFKKNKYCDFIFIGNIIISHFNIIYLSSIQYMYICNFVPVSLKHSLLHLFLHKHGNTMLELEKLPGVDSNQRPDG